MSVDYIVKRLKHLKVLTYHYIMSFETLSKSIPIENKPLYIVRLFTLTRDINITCTNHIPT